MRLLRIATFCFFLIGHIFGAVAFDNKATAGPTTSSSPSITSASTTGSNLIGIAWFAHNDNTTTFITGTPTWGGSNMTYVTRVVLSAGTGRVLEMWRIVAPATGAQTVSGTWATSVRWKMAAITYTGVDQTTPLGTAVTATTTLGTSVTVDISSASGELVISGVLNNDGTTALTQGAGETERFEDNSGANDVAIAGSDEAGAATVTMSYSGSNDRWATIGAPLKPVSASVPAKKGAHHFGV